MQQETHSTSTEVHHLSAAGAAEGADDSDEDDHQVHVALVASAADLARFRAEFPSPFDDVLPTVESVGKKLLFAQMPSGVAEANEWLARNAKRAALVAVRLDHTPRHAVVLTRPPDPARDSPNRHRPLPSCWTARFVRAAAPYFLEARLQPAQGVALRTRADEPAVELLVAASTDHGLL